MGTVLLVICIVELLVLGILYLVFKRLNSIVPPKNNRNFWLAVLIVPPIVLVLTLYIWFWSTSNFQELPFNRTSWDEQLDQRYLYVDDLIDNNRLIGKTKTQLIDILGAVNKEDAGALYYYIGYSPRTLMNLDPDYLVIEINNATATKVYTQD